MGKPDVGQEGQEGLAIPRIAGDVWFAVISPLSVSSTINVSFRRDLRPPDRPSSATSQLALQSFFRGIAKLRVALERLETTRVSLASSPPRSIGTSATSSVPLGLTFDFTTLGSTEEVNTTPTSFSPFGPSFTGASTALPTVGGTYSGAQGDDTLTFQVKDDGTIPSTKILRIEVFDGLGVNIDTLNFKDVPVDTPLSLSNGLELSLSAGTLVKNDTFQLNVFSTVGSTVDPSKPFNGTRNDNPNFEAGLGVTAGSFDVNGVTINVLATDTINTVLNKITASAAGVTATFDTGSETVQLTQKTAGTAFGITLANDTSGFLDATKLSGASEVLPTNNEPDQVISTVGALSGISTGTFTINGVGLSVDVSVDSLNDIIARINSSSAGVTASLSQTTNLLTISPDTPNELVLQDGTSGLFTALNITPGTFATKGATGGDSSLETFVHPDRFKERLAEVGDELESLFKSGAGAALSELIEDGLAQLQDSITDVFKAFVGGSGDSLKSGFGIGVHFLDSSPKLFELDMGRINLALRRDFAKLHDFLFLEADGERQDGLVPSLLDALKRIEGELLEELGLTSSQGVLVNLAA